MKSNIFSAQCEFAFFYSAPNTLCLAFGAEKASFGRKPTQSIPNMHHAKKTPPSELGRALCMPLAYYIGL